MKASLIAALLLPSVALAQANEESAEALLERGRSQFTDGFFDEAVSTLEQAAARATSPSTAGSVQLYLGLSLHAAGRASAAADAFRRALRWDASLRLDPEQYNPALVSMFNEIRAIELPTDQEPEDEPIAERADPATEQAPEREPSEQHERPASRRRPWTWTLLGGAVATLGTAIVLGALGKADHRTWLDTPADSREADELEEAGRAKLLSANLLFGIGGALSVGALVAFFREGRTDRDVQVSLSPTGVAVHGSF